MLQYIEALRIDILQYIEALQYIDALNILKHFNSLCAQYIEAYQYIANYLFLQRTLTDDGKNDIFFIPTFIDFGYSGPTPQLSDIQ